MFSALVVRELLPFADIVSKPTESMLAFQRIKFQLDTEMEGSTSMLTLSQRNKRKTDVCT